MMTRRQAIKTTTLATAAAATLLTKLSAQTNVPAALSAAGTAGATSPFTLPPLPYAYDALEPHIDTMTMQIHHDKHHQAYVNKPQQGPRFGHEDLQKKTTRGNCCAISTPTLPKDLRAPVKNNGGGHYNHSLFWQMMSKTGTGRRTGQGRPRRGHCEAVSQLRRLQG